MRNPFIQYRYLSRQFLLTVATEDTVNLYDSIRKSLNTIGCLNGDFLENDLLISQSLFETEKKASTSIDLFILTKIVFAEAVGGEIPIHPYYTLPELKQLEIPEDQINVPRQTKTSSRTYDLLSLFYNEKRKAIGISNNAVSFLDLISGISSLTNSCYEAKFLDDAYVTNPETLVNIDLSSNDDTTVCNSLIYSIHSDVTKGTLNLNSDGTGDYTPDSGINDTTDTATIKIVCDGASYFTTLTITINPYDFEIVDDSYTAIATLTYNYDLSDNDPSECTPSATLTYQLNTIPQYSTNYSFDGSTGILTYTPDVDTDGNTEILEIEALCNGVATGITSIVTITIKEPPASIPVILCISVDDNTIDYSTTIGDYIQIDYGIYSTGIVENTGTYTFSPPVGEGSTVTLTACFDEDCFYSNTIDCYLPDVDELDTDITINSTDDLSDINIYSDGYDFNGENGTVILDFYDSDDQLVYSETVTVVNDEIDLDLDLTGITDINYINISAIGSCGGCINKVDIIDFCDQTIAGLIYEDLECLELVSGSSNGDGTTTYTFVNDCLPCTEYETGSLIQISSNSNSSTITLDEPSPYYKLFIYDDDLETEIFSTDLIENDPCNLVLARYSRWLGDTSDADEDGVGNSFTYIGGSSGNYINTFQLSDSDGSALAPCSGCEFNIAFYTQDDQLMASAVYDYSSAIDMQADSPSSTVSGSITLDPIYSDTSTSPITISWSDIVSNMVASSCDISSAGAGSLSFNKADFASSLSLENANALAYDVRISVTVEGREGGVSTSTICVNDNDGNIDNVSSYISISDSKSILLGSSTDLHGFGLKQGTNCEDYPVIKKVSTLSGGTNSGVSSSDFEVNSENVFIIGGSSSTSYDLRYYYRNSTSESYDWTSLYDYETVIDQAIINGVFIDDVNLLNSKPQLWALVGEHSSTTSGMVTNNSPYDNDLYHIYWDGSTWTATLLQADVTSVGGLDNGWRNGSTGDIYTLGDGDFGVISYSGSDFSLSETSDSSNYTYTSLLTSTTSQASLSTTVVGQSYYLSYVGDYNSNPSFLSGSDVTDSINYIFWNGSSWENKVIAEFASSTTNTSGYIDNTGSFFDIQSLGSVKPVEQVTDVTQMTSFYIFDPTNDRIFLAEFSTGDLTSSVYSIDISEFISSGTYSNANTSLIF